MGEIMIDEEMIKDKLRKEATTTVEWENTPMIDRPLFVHAYITGAEPRERCIAELKELHESDKKSLVLIAEKGAELERKFTKAKELLEIIYTNKGLLHIRNYEHLSSEETKMLELKLERWFIETEAFLKKNVKNG